MPDINFSVYDQTPLAVDQAIIDQAKQERPRNYLGFSSIGEDCERKLFYIFRRAAKRSDANKPLSQEAKAIKSAIDGHHQESVQADRLRMLPFIDLVTLDQATGKQFEYSLFGGLFKGHPDGIIKGILESPTKTHVWEHKAKELKFFTALKNLREKFPEDQILHEWDFQYYVQAQILMDQAGIDRHYLTVSSAGGRESISIRTRLKPGFAQNIISKAGRIIYSSTLPAKIAEKKEYFKCKFCEMTEICHSGKQVDQSCGTCFYFQVNPDHLFCNATKEKITNMTPCSSWKIHPIFKTEKVEEIKIVEEPKKKSFAWSK